jgi:hypothetical protein
VTTFVAAAAMTLASAPVDASPTGPFRPFWQPLPVWDYWYLLLVPLCLGVSIVYKSIKCHRMRQVPREAAVIFLMILAGMVLAGAALLALVRVMERAR